MSLYVVCLWYFGARRRKRARGHVDRRRWLASRARQSTRWYCVRHVPSEEKTSLAVGRGVAPSLVTEKAARSFAPDHNDSIPLGVRYISTTELIDTACSTSWSKGCVSTVEKAKPLSLSFVAFFSALVEHVGYEKLLNDSLVLHASMNPDRRSSWNDTF